MINDATRMVGYWIWATSCVVIGLVITLVLTYLLRRNTNG